MPIESSVYVHRDEIVNRNAEYMLYPGKGHTLSRSIAAEARINSDYDEKSKDQVPYDPKGVNIFQYNVDEHYRYSDKAVVFDTDEEFMNLVDDFFTRALERRAKAQEGDNA